MNQDISNKTLSLIKPQASTIEINCLYDADIVVENGIPIVLENCKIASIEIAEQSVIKNNINAEECFLLVEQKGEIYLFVDNDGELYISDDGVDGYEINTNAELIFNQKAI
jgi:hypothetical protein